MQYIMVYGTITSLCQFQKIFFSRLYHANKIMFSNILSSIVDSMHINGQMHIPLRFSIKIKFHENVSMGTPVVSIPSYRFSHNNSI